MIDDGREESIHRMFGSIIRESRIGDDEPLDRIRKEDDIGESNLFEGVCIFLKTFCHESCHEAISSESEIDEWILPRLSFSLDEGSEYPFESEYIEAPTRFFVHLSIRFENLFELSSDIWICKV